jgi:hypothetical protein
MGSPGRRILTIRAGRFEYRDDCVRSDTVRDAKEAPR